MTLNVFRFTGLNSALGLKAPVRCATTANITLTGLQTIDGVILQSTDTNLRVLVKNQTDSRQNGIYDAQSGNWTRSTDWDSNDDFVQGTTVHVVQGATQFGWWNLTASDPITLGTSNITFASIDVSLFPDGSAAAPSITFANEPTTGFYRPGAGQIGVSVLGVSSALFTQTGIGIGVTPSYPIDILSATVPQARFRSSGAAAAQVLIDNAAGGNQSVALFYDAGIQKWVIGKQTDNSFLMFDTANNANFLAVTTGGVVTVGETGKSVKVYSGTFNPANTDGVAQLLFSGTWFTGGSATTTKPQFLIEPSGTASTGWNTFGTGLGVNAASGAVGNLIDLQLAGSSQFSVSSGNGQLNFQSACFVRNVAGGLLFAPGNNNGAYFATAGLTLVSTMTFGWAAGSDPTVGTDTVLSRASAGVIKFASANSFSANGAVATAFNNTGPTGSHANPQTWLTIVDSGGTTRYIPCF